MARGKEWSIEYGFCDFVAFVVGFVAGMADRPTRILFSSQDICSFKVGTTIVSLMFKEGGVSIVMQNGDTTVVDTKQNVFEKKHTYMYSGFGLERYLYRVCFATLQLVEEKTYKIVEMYHLVH